MAGLLLAAAVLGFVYSAAPGAVNTQGLRRGLDRGFLPALTLQVGALAGISCGQSSGLRERPSCFTSWPYACSLRSGALPSC